MLMTAGDTHLPAAPYTMVDNPNSLLDVSDLVFIDAPGTGFGRLMGKDPEKAFWGMDGDANAYARFIQRFISKYGRWNSAKFIFGESYGTTRSAVLADLLENKFTIDMNGVILLSQIFNFTTDIDAARATIPAWICRTSWRCRPLRRRRGTTRSCPISRRRWSRS